MGTSIQQGYTVAASGGGWEEVSGSPYQPTTSVTSITFTGLSAYRAVKVAYAMSVGTGDRIDLDCRVSGGVWRVIGQMSPAAAGTLDSLYGEISIFGFGQDIDVKVVVASGGTGSSVLDASDNANYDSGHNQYSAAPSWNEVWDELRLDAFSYDSALDRRGMIFVYGLV